MLCFGIFGPKGALGSQNNVEQVAEVSEEIWRFLKKFCEPSLSNLLPPARLFLNLVTRWRSSTPDSRNTLLISTWTKVLKACSSIIYMFKATLIRLEFNRNPSGWFSKQHTIHQSASFSFMKQESQSLISDGLSFFF